MVTAPLTASNDSVDNSCYVVDVPPPPPPWEPVPNSVYELSAEDRQLAEIWRQAASELCVQVKAPFVLPEAGSDYHFAAVLPQFGIRERATGLAIRVIRDDEPIERKNWIWRAAANQGLLPVSLVKDYFLQSSVETMKDFLKTFHWCGEGERPVWHLQGPSL